MNELLEAGMHVRSASDESSVTQVCRSASAAREMSGFRLWATRRRWPARARDVCRERFSLPLRRPAAFGSRFVGPPQVRSTIRSRPCASNGLRAADGQSFDLK